LGCRVQGARFGDWGLGCRVGCRVQGEGIIPAASHTRRESAARDAFHEAYRQDAPRVPDSGFRI